MFCVSLGLTLYPTHYKVWEPKRLTKHLRKWPLCVSVASRAHYFGNALDLLQLHNVIRIACFLKSIFLFDHFPVKNFPMIPGGYPAGTHQVSWGGEISCSKVLSNYTTKKIWSYGFMYMFIMMVMGQVFFFFRIRT